MTGEQLDQLHKALAACREMIDSGPERFQSSTAAHLAEMDADAIATAQQVVHRLMLWKMYPTVSPESYLQPLHSVKV